MMSRFVKLCGVCLSVFSAVAIGGAAVADEMIGQGVAPTNPDLGGAPTETVQSLDSGSYQPQSTVWNDWITTGSRHGTACPHWYGRAEMLALYRNANDKRPYATLGAGGPVALSTSDFRTEYDAGVRVAIGRTLGKWRRLEVSYFGTYTWDDAVAINNLDANTQGGVGNLYSPFTGFGNPAGVVGLDFNEFASIRLQSRLTNGEVNMRQTIMMLPGAYETSWLLGARYLDVRERFGYFTQSSVPGPAFTSNDVDIRTTNELIGVQIGLLNQWVVAKRTWIEFEMKGGVFQNEVTLDRTYTVVDQAGASVVFPGVDRRNRTSFVGDLSLQLNYRFAHSWTFYAGYNAIWVTGLALAERNFISNDATLIFGPAQVNHSGSVVYHGMDFGLVYVH